MPASMSILKSSTTMAAPASGGLRLNNATIGSVTALAISATSADAGNPSISALVNTWDDSSTTAHRGTLTIRKASDTSKWAQFDVTAALTDNTTWLQLTVAYLGGPGGFSAADALVMSHARTGDAGAGSVGGLTANQVPIASGASAIGSSVGLTSGQLLIGGAGAPTAQTVTGDVTITAAGVTAIGAGKVTFAMMASAALATAAQWLANTANLILTTDKVWSSAALVTLTDAATVTPDMSTFINATWTLGAVGRTLANPTNPKVGQTGVIYLVQDGTGSRTITSWGTNYKFSGGTKPTLSTAASTVDVLAYHVKSSTEIECFFTGGMS